MIEVICADGAVRHEPFASVGEAQRWAEWGHCCLTAHTYREDREIKEGDTVAHRQSGEVIGQVDSLGNKNGSRWAIVSWPSDHPDLPRDERGRRGQAFTLSALRAVDAEGRNQ